MKRGNFFLSQSIWNCGRATVGLKAPCTLWRAIVTPRKVGKTLPSAWQKNYHTDQVADYSPLQSILTSYQTFPESLGKIGLHYRWRKISDFEKNNHTKHLCSNLSSYLNAISFFFTLSQGLFKSL